MITTALSKNRSMLRLIPKTFKPINLVVPRQMSSAPKAPPKLTPFPKAQSPNPNKATLGDIIATALGTMGIISTISAIVTVKWDDYELDKYDSEMLRTLKKLNILLFGDSFEQISKSPVVKTPKHVKQEGDFVAPAPPTASANTDNNVAVESPHAESVKPEVSVVVDDIVPENSGVEAVDTSVNEISTFEENKAEVATPVEEPHATTEQEQVVLNVLPIVDASSSSSEVDLIQPLHAKQETGNSEVKHVEEPSSPEPISADMYHRHVETNTAALKRDLERSVLSNLNNMSDEQLRVEINRLAYELFDRSKWEGIRLHDALLRVEAEVSKKYTELLDKQRAEYNKQTSDALAAMNDSIIDRSAQLTSKAVLTFETELNESMKNQQHSFDTKLREELDKQMAKRDKDFETRLKEAFDSLQVPHDKRLSHVQEEINSLVAAEGSLRSRFEERNKAQAASLRFLEQSIAIRALEAAVDGANQTASPIPVQTAIGSLRKAFPNDKFVGAVVEALSTDSKETVSVEKEGILSHSALYARFLVLRDEMRKIALAPPTESTMIGLFLGSALAKLSSAPTGPIAGGNGVEEILTRVNFHLEQGQLVSAVKELETVASATSFGKSGSYVKLLSEDWRRLVHARIAAEMAVKSLKSYAHVNHASLSQL